MVNLTCCVCAVSRYLFHQQLQEVLDFQVDKQARLNQLPACISLRRHQLVLLGQGDGGSSSSHDNSHSNDPSRPSSSGPEGVAVDTTASGADTVASLEQLDLSEALVFSSHELDKLKHRMQVCWCVLV